MTPNRRRFLTQAALGAAALAAPGDALTQPQSPRPAAPSQNPPPLLDPAPLVALGEAILPETLGAAGQRRAVEAFLRWVTAYEPVAEEMHGYGSAELTYTPAHPAPGWQAQLGALDALARRTRRRAFIRLDVPARRAVVEAALARVSGTALPASPLGATHVAVALLAHWAATSEAQDLAYGARIGAGQCRGLAETSRPPLPLAGEPRP